MAGKVSRRTVLLGAGAAGLASTAVGGFALGTLAAVPQQPQLASAAIPFYGPHQPGIATPPPASLSFVALDLTSQSSDDLRSLLRVWTAAISSMMAGEPVTTRPVRGGDPADTSEATGLGPSRLTVTVGFGPRLFAGGLASRRPPALIDLPAFPGDALEPARSDGDLCAQVCADDPQVAYHAVRTLTRLAAGVASPRWVQAGFRQPPGGAMNDATPRNLLGFKDGTDNLKASSETSMARHVW
ncbi:MAG TPA: Dyp-type peroxidase, partial [Ktedonobacterales bacterium]